MHNSSFANYKLIHFKQTSVVSYKKQHQRRSSTTCRPWILAQNAVIYTIDFEQVFRGRPSAVPQKLNSFMTAIKVKTRTSLSFVSLCPNS